MREVSSTRAYARQTQLRQRFFLSLRVLCL